MDGATVTIAGSFYTNTIALHAGLDSMEIPQPTQVPHALADHAGLPMPLHLETELQINQAESS